MNRPQIRQQEPENQGSNSLRQQIAASHLRIAGLGMACVTFALIGCLTLNIFLQQIAQDSAGVNLSTSGLQAGIQNSLVSLKTAAITGNPTFLEQHENAWIQFIHPNRELLRHSVSNRSLHLNGGAFLHKAEDITEDFLSGLHQFRSAQKDIETVLTGKASDVEFRPATGSLVEEGNAILQSALLLTEEPIVRKSESRKKLELFVRFFHEAHTEALLFALGNETASPSELKRKLKSAADALAAADEAWPTGRSDAHKEFARLSKAFVAYREGAIQSVVMNKGYTPNNAVFSLLADATKTATKLQSQLEKIRSQHNFYADESLRTLAIMTIVVLLIALASALGMVLMAFRHARRQGRAIAGPVRHLVRAAQRFSQTQEVSGLPDSTIQELRDLTNHFKDMCFKLVDEKHRMEKVRHQLEKSNTARSELLVMVSDQLRRPLKSLTQATTQLSDDDLSLPQQERTAEVKEATNKLIELLEHIALFSELDAGGVKLREEPFSTVTFVEGVIDYFAPAFERKGLNLTVFIDPGLPNSLLGDAHHIRLALVELMRNALDHTATGGVALEFSGGRSENGLYRFTIKVIDTGSGVQDQVQHIVTQAGLYNQDDVSMPSFSTQTLGLGLAIAKRVAELHGGSLEITRNEEDIGTKCVLNVNIKTEGSGTIETFRQLPQGNALLLHHQSLAGSVLERQLSSWGLKVKHIQSVKGARDYIRVLSIRNERIDWVVADEEFTGGDLDLLEGLVRSVTKDQDNHKTLLLSFDDNAHQLAPHPIFRLSKHVSKPLKERALFKSLSTKSGPSDLVADITKTNSAIPFVVRDTNRNNLRVLVVDPDRSFQIILSTFIRQMGHQCELVQSAEEALSAAANSVYDAVILNSDIEGLNSVNLMRQIRKAHGKDQELTVVALVRAGISEDDQLFSDIGFDAVLEQPLDFVQLTSLLRSLRPEPYEDAFSAVRRTAC